MKLFIFGLLLCAALYYFGNSMVAKAQISAQIARDKMEHDQAQQDELLADQKRREGEWWYGASQILGSLL